MFTSKTKLRSKEHIKGTSGNLTNTFIWYDTDCRENYASSTFAPPPKVAF
jgi:hypothetical protein